MSMRIFAILVRYHHARYMEGRILETHLKDVAVTPAALAGPG